jgi:hypothetical protein
VVPGYGKNMYKKREAVITALVPSITSSMPSIAGWTVTPYYGGVKVRVNRVVKEEL